jgi:hypothetical protein
VADEAAVPLTVKVTRCRRRRRCDGRAEVLPLPVAPLVTLAERSSSSSR